MTGEPLSLWVEILVSAFLLLGSALVLIGATIAEWTTTLREDSERDVLTKLHNRASFEDAIQKALNFAGPANFCPVLVGAFAACEFGYRPIQGLDVQSEIHSAASRVFEALWPPSCGQSYLSF